VHVPFDGERAKDRHRLEAADDRRPDKLFDRALEEALRDLLAVFLE